MKPPMLLPLLLLTWAAAGIADIRPRDMYGVMGSSVTFPSIKITRANVYDFRKVRNILIVTYHGSENIRPPYNSRVHFSSITGEIELRNLTEEDSGIYQQVVNLKVVAVFRLLVIEPAITPTLEKVNETTHGDQCHVLLECKVQGSGPLNVAFLKDGEEIAENITTIDHSRVLSIDAWDPSSCGSYTCRFLSPLGSKTSSAITIPTPDESCKKASSDLHHWSVIVFIFIIITAVIIAFVLAYKIYRRNSSTNSGESGDATPEDASESQLQLLNTTLSGDGRRTESPCNVSMADEGEPGESGDATPEDASESELQLLNTTLSGDGRTELSCNVSIADEGEPEESWDVRPEETSQSELQKLDATPPGDGRRTASFCKTSLTDDGEHDPG